MIIEEKENPNMLLNFNNEPKHAKLKTQANVGLVVAQKKSVECKEIAIQCMRTDEDMVMCDNMSNTPFWKLLAHRRFRSLLETMAQNSQVIKKVLFSSRM